jgi:hypothetical protein
MHSCGCFAANFFLRKTAPIFFLQQQKKPIAAFATEDNATKENGFGKKDFGFRV